MKKLFTISLLLFSLNLFSQTDSTKIKWSEYDATKRIEWLEADAANLKNDIRFLKLENKNINLRLEKFTRQYFIGVNVEVIGWVIGGAGAAIFASGNYDAGAVFMGIGSVVMFSGSIAMIGSHNRLKREQKELSVLLQN